MDFQLTEQQALLQQTVRDFVLREVKPAVPILENEGQFPRQLFQKCAELGFFRFRYPEEAGGLGGDPVGFILMMEELAAGNLALAAVVGMQALNGTELLHQLGTSEQKTEWLEPALAGEKIGTIAITEPNAGSDIGGIETSARQVAQGWVLNGSKTWITSATVADFFLVAAQTGEDARAAGIDLFLVERSREGLSIGREIEKLGTHGSATSEIFLDNVRLPPENRLGQRGSGMAHLRKTLAEVRAMTGALGLGLGRAALEDSLRYADEREQFGRPIAGFQAISHKLAAMATQLEAARWLVYRAAWAVTRGAPDIKLAAMAKFFASEMANQLADQATRIFGSYGFAMEYPAQRYLRDARFLLYGAGTSEILLTIIARQLETDGR